jgi:hypothetical protein
VFQSNVLERLSRDKQSSLLDPFISVNHPSPLLTILHKARVFVTGKLFKVGLTLNPIRVEHLEVPNFKGRLSSSFANVRPIRKNEKIVRDKRSSLFEAASATKRKSFGTFNPVANVIKLFTAVSYDFS